MMVFTSYVIILSITFGLVAAKPIEVTSIHAKKSSNASLDHAFRQAEVILHQYFYLMNSDTDHLVHALLYILMNNPELYRFMPHEALNIAMKNVADRLGQHALNTLTKPMLLTFEKNAQNKSKPLLKFNLTEEIKEQIEDVLDKFMDKKGEDTEI
jgi:hypothetical protein